MSNPHRARYVRASRRILRAVVPALMLALGLGLRETTWALPVGGEFQVNTYTQDNEGRPAVAADADGDFVVVWSNRYAVPEYYGVFGRRYTSAGAAIGTEFQLSTDFSSSTAVAADADGDFVVVWASGDGDSSGVFGRRYTSGGGAVGGEFQVNTFTDSDQYSPDVATDADGDFVVVWTSSARLGDYSQSVFGRRYTSAGTPIGGDFQVNAYTTGEQYSPAVAADAGGDFVVVWTNDGEGAAGYKNIFGRRYTSAGAPIGGDFQVNTYTTGFQGFPAVAADADGDFVVIWNSGDGNGSGIFGRGYASTGVPIGGDFQVNTYTTDLQGSDDFSSHVAAGAAGNFVVVWTSHGQAYGIFGQRLQPTAEAATQNIGAGGTVTTDTESDGATAEDPVETTVTSPTAGTISIFEGVIGSPPGGFQFVGQQVTITAPGATAGDPLVVVFELDASVIPAGETQNSIQVFRNGVAVPACTGTPGDADPDPCVSSRVLQGDGDVEITVLTSAASDWNFGVQASPPTPTLSSFGWLMLAGLLPLAMGWTLYRRRTTR